MRTQIKNDNYIFIDHWGQKVLNFYPLITAFCFRKTETNRSLSNTIPIGGCKGREGKSLDSL